MMIPQLKKERYGEKRKGTVWIGRNPKRKTKVEVADIRSDERKS